jgi:lipid-binding SYLF domain-containing protein
MTKRFFDNPGCTLKHGAILGILFCLMACSSSTSNNQPASPEAESKARRALDMRFDNATATVPEFRKNMPDSVASQTQCVAVIPGMVKAGLVVGGKSGKGFAACQTEHGWSPPAPITIGGANIGAQVGAQSTDWLMLVESNKAKQAFLQGKFRIGVDASASAGPVGAGRGTSTDTEGSDVVSYSKASGLYAGAVLNGATISQDEDATRVLYGNMAPFQEILTAGRPMPENATAKRFLATISEAFGSRAVSSR